jgi:hypothetical protein
MNGFEIDDYVWHEDFRHVVAQVSKDGNKVKIFEYGDSEEDARWVGKNSVEKLTEAEILEYHEEEIADHENYDEEAYP